MIESTDPTAASTGAEVPSGATQPSSRARAIRRIATVVGIAAILFVAAVGAMRPMPAAGAAATGATSGLAGADPLGGLNFVDLAAKAIVVVALLVITLRVLGRMQATGPKKNGRMKVLESRSIAPKASIHLVAVGERRLVVGLTPSGMVSLAELDSAELETSPTDAEAEASGATISTAAVGLPAASPLAPAFGAMLNSLLAPVDAVTGRLVGLLGGGRAR